MPSVFAETAPRPATAGSPVPWITLAVAAVAAVVFILPGSAEVLEYDRAALARGELWRVLTGHLVHFDRSHLTWDVAVLLGLGFATERQSRAGTASVLLVAAVAISAALWCLQAALLSYRGLSGLDCALAGRIAGSLIRHADRPARVCGTLLVAFVAGKCGYEVATALPLFAHAGSYVPVPLAHLVGFAIGVGSAFVGHRHNVHLAKRRPGRLFAAPRAKPHRTAPASRCLSAAARTVRDRA